MSCEGNRHRFLSRAAPLLGLDARQMEKVYQAAKAGGILGKNPEDLQRKTRLLFDAMRGLGIRPPAHSKDGLPKLASQIGYAALYDYVLANARVQHISPRKDLLAEQADNPMLEVLPVHPATLVDNREYNAAGYHWHSRRGDPGTTPPVRFGRLGLHTRVADKFGMGNAGLDLSNPEIAQYAGEFLREDANGFLRDGYDRRGFDRDGFDTQGFSLYGLRRDESRDMGLVRRAARKTPEIMVRRRRLKNPKLYSVDIEGFSPKDGFRPAALDEREDRDRFGFDRLGFREGRSWTGYDEHGLDARGKPAPQRKGYDAWGYHRKEGLTAPDARGRRYNLLGWVYDEQTGECYDPDHPARRMVHAGSFKLRKVNGRMKVVPVRSYVPDEDALVERIRNPSIRMGEYRRGGGPLYRYGARANDERMALIALSHPVLRYMRSEIRLDVHPEARFLGVRLRCPKCGQFTGAKPHMCPHYGEKVVVFGNEVVIAYRRGAFRPEDTSDIRPSATRAVVERLGALGAGGQYIRNFPDVLEELIASSGYVYSTKGSLGPVHPAKDIFDSTGLHSEASEVHSRYGYALKHSLVAAQMLLEDPENETAVLLENPFVSDFDPDFEGGALPGFHWKSGLSREGYDPLGFHFLTRRTRDGLSLREIAGITRIRGKIREAAQVLEQAGKSAREMLEATYSRIASAMAGAPRRVRLTEQGGPRPGMFWTDMRGRIQAERYPLKNTPNDSEVNNLLAMKAGIYHELGHEEDTPAGVFARVLAIANGEEAVEGIPRPAAGLVAEVYNILEDGRMERQQARRRRGVAATLAADARINPRWDERVGEDLPVAHQVMGMLLYRALPFFRVRAEVLEQAPPRVRTLYEELQPLVDRAMRSPEEAFQASIEITRRLVNGDEALRQWAERMTGEQLQGGQWATQSASGGDADGQGGAGGSAVLISALPRPGRGVPADESLPIPPRGWGGQDDEPGAGRRSGQGQQDDAPGAGRRSGQGTQGNEPGAGRRSGQGMQGDEPAGEPAESSRNAGSAGSVSPVAAEPDQAFFDSIAAGTDILDVLDGIYADVRRGTDAVLRSPVGRALSRPLDSIDNLVVDDPDDPDENHAVRILRIGEDNAAREALSRLDTLRGPARAEGRKVARRLETLREEIRKKVGLQTSGQVDRKRFKRAVSGAKTVYARTRLQDVTSLAVSIQLDMSGSMHKHVVSGELTGAALALEEALRRLDAEYMVSGFGTHYALFKSFGDDRISDEQLALMTSRTLGGTDAAPGMRLGLLGLKERRSANKLHIMMTDGALQDTEKAIRQAEEMRRKGILPFGIFFGKAHTANLVRQDMDAVFGAGNWVRIEYLSDMSTVVARRIEQIYRRILATR